MSSSRGGQDDRERGTDESREATGRRHPAQSRTDESRETLSQFKIFSV